MPTLLEVCVESAAGAVLAAKAGADRVELCQSLLEGGTTPSPGTIERAVEECDADVFVIVRPRGGDFLYDAAELDVLRRDVVAIRRAGAAGVVIGALTTDGRVDELATRTLIDAARPLGVTFHRAFDMSRDADEALDTLIGLGVDRVLSSGQAPNVVEGGTRLRELIERAGDDLIVMPGGGVREHNIKQVVETTGAKEIHFRAGTHVDSGMSFRNPHCRMGTGEAPGEYEIERTDPTRVRECLSALRDSSDGS